MTFPRRAAASAVAVAVLLLHHSPSAVGQPARTYEKANTTYEDVRFDLTNAIVNAGLAVASTGKMAEMLDRTGEAVGATRKVFRNAEFFTFCSSQVTRALVEADPANIAFCPTTVFIYETEERPGTIVVGYRRPATEVSGAAPATVSALAVAEGLLDRVAREAVQ